MIKVVYVPELPSGVLIKVKGNLLVGVGKEGAAKE